MEAPILPVILSGGSGSRLWPLSRQDKPKQFLSLLEQDTLLQATVKRVTGLRHTLDPLIICNHAHRFMVAEQLRQMDVEPGAILLEPMGRNTAPAVMLASLYAVAKQQKDALLLVVPSDAFIAEVQAFYQAVDVARACAAQGYLVTFGIVPTKPETGYGYIRSGEGLADMAAYRVDSFVEKPDLSTAQRYLDAGDYYWNSGMFLFQASTLLREMQRYAPEVCIHSQSAFEARREESDFCVIDPESFAKNPSISIDYAVMEKTHKAAVVPMDAGWSDIGSWSALWDISDKDADGNVVQGDVILQKVKNAYVRAEHRSVAVLGLEDVIVVETDDTVLVAHQDDAQSVRTVAASVIPA